MQPQRLPNPIGVGRIFAPMEGVGKKPLVNAIRNSIERLQDEQIVSPDDPALAQLKSKLVLRIVERDESPPAKLDDLDAEPHEHESDCG